MKFSERLPREDALVRLIDKARASVGLGRKRPEEREGREGEKGGEERGERRAPHLFKWSPNNKTA